MNGPLPIGMSLYAALSAAPASAGTGLNTGWLVLRSNSQSGAVSFDGQRQAVGGDPGEGGRLVGLQRVEPFDPGHVVRRVRGCLSERGARHSAPDRRGVDRFTVGEALAALEVERP